MSNDLRQAVFGITNSDEFDKLALEIFRFQADDNQIFRKFISALNIQTSSIKSISRIPFLPVSFFKSHKIVSGSGPAELVFESSGTTGAEISRHFITDPGIYEMSFNNGFRMFYGDPEEFFIAALLPSYSERENSSLIYMVNNLINGSRNGFSGFYNNDPEELIKKIEIAKSGRMKVILIGVSFALLDLAEKYSPDLSGITVIETGGMKGRRKEITREELHNRLKSGFNVSKIHSEYGMTELLSQAWSKGEGIFYTPPWMKISIRDTLDPLTTFNTPGKTGGINIIDLANLYSCSFLSVNDIGKMHKDGGFEVLGRFDNSDIRGCNLMVE